MRPIWSARWQYTTSCVVTLRTATPPPSRPTRSGRLPNRSHSLPSRPTSRSCRAMLPDHRPRDAEPALVIDPTPKRPNWHLLSPGPARERLMNPTDWRLKLDPRNVGVTEEWPARALPADAVPAEVPGVWNTVAPSYSGVAWYEATFPRQGNRPTRRLVFGGANYLTDAWLNGVYLGRHEGGHDAFSFRCTLALR